VFRILLNIIVIIAAFSPWGGIESLAQETPDSLSTNAEAEAPEVPGQWGHLAGQFVIRGDAPKPVLEDLSDAPKKDLSIGLINGKIPFDEGIVLNEKKQLRDVFVWMYVGRGAKIPDKFHPSYSELKK